MEVISDTDTKKLDAKALDIFKSTCKRTLEKKDSFVLAVPGGRAVRGIFRLFGSLKDIPWEDIEIFMVDERLPDTFGEQSNFRLAFNTFIGRLLIDKKLGEENIHPFVYINDSIEESLKDYDSQLRDAGSRYDMAILSAGEDSHVASLFPDHPSVKDDSEYHIYMDDSPKPPPQRISASRKLILRSECCILLFYGEQKKDAYKKFRDRDKDIFNCPSKLANKIKNSFILTDIN